MSVESVALIRSNRKAREPQSSWKTAPGGSSKRFRYQSGLSERAGNDAPSCKQEVGVSLKGNVRPTPGLITVGDGEVKGTGRLVGLTRPGDGYKPRQG